VPSAWSPTLVAAAAAAVLAVLADAGGVSGFTLAAFAAQNVSGAAPVGSRHVVVPRFVARAGSSAGHGAGQVHVGHQACLGHGGGHTTWTCRTCDQTVFGPPLNTHCAALDGPAVVRISTQPS